MFYVRKGLIFLLLWLGLGAGSQVMAETDYIARDGELDLAGWPDERPVLLAGEWRFGWATLAEDGEAERLQDRFTLPSTWDGNGQHETPYPGQGFATFSLTIRNVPPGQWAMMIPDLSSSYRLMIDGEWEAGGGTVAANPRDYVPYHGIHWLDLERRGGDIEVVLQVANFSHHSGGPWQPIWFGSEVEINKYVYQHLVYESVVTLFLLIVALVLLAEFLIERTDLTGIWLGLFALLLSIRLGTTSFAPMYWFLDTSPDWDLHMRIIYGSVMAAPLPFLAWLRRVFPRDFSQRTQIGLTVPFGVSLIACLLLPPSWFSALLPVFSLLLAIASVLVCLTIVRALIHRRESAWLILPGFVFLGIAVFQDMLINNQIISAQSWAPGGFLLFVITLTFNFLFNRGAARRKIQALSTQLAAMNRELENRVTERTEALAEKATALEDANARLSELASRDGLTGLLNRRAVLELLNNQRERSQPVAVLWIDLDHFKSVNDTFGHAAGDAVLAAFGDLLRTLGRDRDVLGRLGGEEFAVVLMDCDATGAEAFARRLQASLRALAIEGWPEIRNLTASTGIAVGCLNRIGAEALLNAADHAMYEVKHSTRDGVKLAQTICEG
ncbi:sensor domain-containing diguanylate cyclase [Thalassolituus sp. LLYu03]|uniref:sensor domain-containing diguanylate cyclase n=1 Tax=Thalassolituus sp. LLYu03 TaxID=3421656 RepID=UPI003D2D96B9